MLTQSTRNIGEGHDKSRFAIFRLLPIGFAMDNMLSLRYLCTRISIKFRRFVIAFSKFYRSVCSNCRLPFPSVATE